MNKLSWLNLFFDPLLSHVPCIGCQRTVRTWKSTHERRWRQKNVGTLSGRRMPRLLNLTIYLNLVCHIQRRRLRRCWFLSRVKLKHLRRPWRPCFQVGGEGGVGNSVPYAGTHRFSQWKLLLFRGLRDYLKGINLLSSKSVLPAVD